MPNRLLRTRLLTSRRLSNSSAGAEALYVRLMLVADDYGRYYGEPQLVQSACYPRGEKNVTDALAELIERDLVQPYESGGELYLSFETWDQELSRPVPKYPPPPGVVDPVIACNACGVTFTPTRSDQRYCSVKCRVRGHRANVTAPEHSVTDVTNVTHGDGVGDGVDKDFITFWDSYPRRVGKRAARAAFGKALKRALADEIIAGAQRYAQDPNRDGQFTAHPTTWLNRDGWEDDPLPPKGSGPSPVERPASYFEAKEPDPAELEALAEAMQAKPWRPK